MNAPERIWAWSTGISNPSNVWMPVHPRRDAAEYLLATPAVLADQPEVQALVVAAVKAERERCAEIADRFHQRALEWAKNVRGLEDYIGETDSYRIAAAIRATPAGDGEGAHD